MPGYCLRSLTSASTCFTFARTDKIEGYSFGSAVGNDKRLEHEKVSKKHFILTVSSENIQIIDLQSSNGTYVNGVKIAPNFPMDLKENDVIGIGCDKINLHELSQFNYVYRLEKKEIKREESGEEIDCVYDSSAGPSDLGEKYYTCELIDLTDDDDVTVEPSQENFQQVDENLTAASIEPEESTASISGDEDRKRPRELTEDLDSNRDNKKLKKSPTAEFSTEVENSDEIVENNFQQVILNLKAIFDDYSDNDKDKSISENSRENNDLNQRSFVLEKFSDEILTNKNISTTNSSTVDEQVIINKHQMMMMQKNLVNQKTLKNADHEGEDRQEKSTPSDGRRGSKESKHGGDESRKIKRSKTSVTTQEKVKTRITLESKEKEAIKKQCEKRSITSESNVTLTSKLGNERNSVVVSSPKKFERQSIGSENDKPEENVLKCVSSKNNAARESIKKERYRIPKITRRSSPKTVSFSEKLSTFKFDNSESCTRNLNDEKFIPKKFFPVESSSSKVGNNNSRVRLGRKGEFSFHGTFPRESSSQKIYYDSSRNRMQQNMILSSKKTLPMESSSNTHDINSYASRCTTSDEKMKFSYCLLKNICKWRPEWILKNNFDVKSKELPPIIMSSELPPYLTFYNKIGNYSRLMTKFLSLELWAQLLTDINKLNLCNKPNPTLLVAINKNSSLINDHDVTLTEFTIELMRNKAQMDASAYPKIEDLIVLSNTQKQFKPMIAFIEEMEIIYLTKDPIFNKFLLTTVRNPSVLITYKVIVNFPASNFQHEEPQNLQSIGNISYFVRLINAVSNLNSSPLRSAILNPKDNREVFSLPTINNYESYKFITGDRLSGQQKEIILQVTDAVVEAQKSPFPKICVINGLPGTGKTQMIVNIATELIYGNHRMKNRKTHRILICAHSNAAVDELTIRLLKVQEEIKVKGSQKPFRIVRAGPIRYMHPGVIGVSINELQPKHVNDHNNQIIKMDENIEQQRKLYEAKKRKIIEKINLQSDLPKNERDKLQKECKDLDAQIQLLKKYNQSPVFNDKETFDQEHKVLADAHIVTCTLPSCFTHEMKTVFSGNIQFGTCIIDEASMSHEPESLLPLRLGVKQLILVGDSNQISSTLSEVAKEKQYDKSLFTRLNEVFDLVDKNNPIVKLDMQYRTAAEIIAWPVKFFGLKLNTRVEIPKFWPFHQFRMFDHNCKDDHPLMFNSGEAKFVKNLIYSMATSGLEQIRGNIRIGVVTPYIRQREKLSGLIEESAGKLPQHIKNKIDIQVNRTDWFRGQEYDIMILSCTRSEELGFLSDIQRLHYIFTRVKYSFFMCGNFDFLTNQNFDGDEAYKKSRQAWLSLLEHAKESDSYVEVNDITAKNIKARRLIMKSSNLFN